MHITQVMIILIIKNFYCLYILIYKREKFEVINSRAGETATSLSISKFKDMYLNSKSIQEEKTSSSLSHYKGSESIKVSKININWYCYTKRTQNYKSNTNLWSNTRPIYIENVSKSLTVYKQKNIIKYQISTSLSVSLYNNKPNNIIKFISSSKTEHNINHDLCNAKDKRLNDSQGLAFAYNNKNCLNILLIVGIVLCLGAPSLIYALSGVNIYDDLSITESIYSRSLFNIRLCCATVFFNMLLYFCVLNKNRLKVFTLNKNVM